MTKKQSIISLIASLALVFLTSGLSSLLSKTAWKVIPIWQSRRLLLPELSFQSCGESCSF